MNRRRWSWVPPVAALGAAILFTSLGAWQLERANQKAAMIAAIERGRSAPAVDLPHDPAAWSGLAYQRVRVTGVFAGDRQFLLDNRQHEGRIGFDVLTPLVLGDDRAVLVDRGWVPATVQRRPARPIALALEREVTVTGRLWLPEAGIALGSALTGAEGQWPRLATRVDYDAIARALGRDVLAGVIRSEPSAPWTLTARTLRPPFGSMRHVGYAVQWFALALTVVIVTVVLHRRASTREES